MPAPSWTDLQQYESQFDAALESILEPFSAAPFGFTLFGQQAVPSLTAPRLEYQFALGSPAGPTDAFQVRAAVGLAPRAVAWNFSFLFRFVYDRTKLTAAQVVFPGTLRELLAPPMPPAEGAFSSSVLPWYAVVALSETRAIRGLVRDQEREKQWDAFESTWEGIFHLRPEYFPD